MKPILLLFLSSFAFSSFGQTSPVSLMEKGDSILFLEAGSLYEQQEYAESLKRLESMSQEAQKGSIAVLYLTGMNKLSLQEYDSALESFNLALNVAEHSDDLRVAEIYAKRGFTFFLMKNFSAAISDLTIYEKENPDSYEAAYLLAYSFWENGDRAKAIALLEKFEGKDPIMISLLAELYLKAETYLEALNLLKPAVAEFKNDLNLLEQISIAYSGLEYYDDALLAIDKVIGNAPDYGRAYYLKGFYLESLEEEDEANKYYALARARGYEWE